MSDLPLATIASAYSTVIMLDANYTMLDRYTWHVGYAIGYAVCGLMFTGCVAYHVGRARYERRMRKFWAKQNALELRKKLDRLAERVENLDR